MKRIWKYVLRVTDEQSVSMPKGGEILSIQMQGASLCLWALVDHQQRLEARTFNIYGTGHPIDDSAPTQLQYLDSVQMENGALVWHIFERIN